MPVPPKPRLVLVLERTTGSVTLAAWQLPTDDAVDVTPGVAGIEDALDWTRVWSPQEGPAVDMATPDSFFFGAQNVQATTVTRYLPYGYGDGSAPTSTVSYRMPVAGTLSAMRVRHNAPSGNGEDIVYTLRKGGGATALAVTLGSLTPTGENLVDSVAVAVDDDIDIEVTKAVGIGSSPNEITVTMRFEPT